MQQHIDQRITDTLRENYMPYAMSVIISRAIPEIDGFKPSHRKLLYMMYKMGLLGGEMTKCANVVGATMKLNPHGDQAIYDTLVRLSKDHEALLYPYVDSKGNFGKHYSGEMAYAASRYTECRLMPICRELFSDIDKDTVDFVDNYDGKMKEPTLFPATFPSVLVNANMGIAVGMASNICSFNLGEVCRTAAALIENPEHDIASTMPAPDFSTGGEIILSHEQMRAIYETGRGSFKIRARYRVDPKSNTVYVYEIPYTTSVELIVGKITDLYKEGKLREVSDVKDLSDKHGLNIAIELRRGVDPEELMTKLFRFTPLEDSFGCNFNILVGGMPRVMGVREIFEEWTAFRSECVRRRLFFDREKKSDRLHLLEGMQKILLDIDRAIAIIRQTESDSEVVPNLMIEFGIDQTQAEFIAEIKLRHLNREYILDKLSEISTLKDELADLEETLADRKKFYRLMTDELRGIAEKYGEPRRSGILFEDEVERYVEEKTVEDYPVVLFFSREGYFKKITPQSLRSQFSGAQKVKEGDEIVRQLESSNGADLIAFTDKCQAYKAHVSDFADSKASSLGDYLPGVLGLDPDEKILYTAVTADYSEKLLIFYTDGHALKTDLSSFATKTNRKKLMNAYCPKLSPAAFFVEKEEREYLLITDADKGLLVHAALMPFKQSRSSQGSLVITLKKQHLAAVEEYQPGRLLKEHQYRTKSLPAAPRLLGVNDTARSLLGALHE